MQAVILAAGEGVRMRPLTLKKPKPLVEVNGKPLIKHIGEALPKEIDELIIVIGYKGDQIKKYCGNKFCGRPVVYVEQPKKLGTARALELCKDLLRNDSKFLLLFGDDIHSKEALARCVKYNLALLVAEADTPEQFGVVYTNPNYTIKEIIEKPSRPLSRLVSTGAMVLDHRIFNFSAVQHSSGEYYLTDMIDQLVKKHPVRAVPTDFWIPVGTPKDVNSAAEKLLGRAFVALPA